MKKVLALVLALAMVLAAVGCTVTTTTTTTTSDGTTTTTETTTTENGTTTTDITTQVTGVQEDTTTEEEITRGGVLKISSSIPTTLDFTQIRGIMEIAYMCPIYETLMRYSEDGTPEPYLLESMEGDAEALTWTMKVRDGIYFTDGSKLDADAVAWNLNTYKECGVLSATYYSNFDYAEAVDDLTVVCHFTAWDQLFNYSLCRTTLIGSKQTFEAAFAEGEESRTAITNETPCGTGPFKFVSIETDVNMVLDKNDNYWQGEVYLDGIEYTYYAQEVVAATAVTTGELDGMITEAYSIVNQLLTSGVDLTSYACAVPSYAYTLCFNMKEGDPFADVRVRQAASYAINPEEINNTLTYGFGTVSNQWALPGSAVYNDDVDGQSYNVETAKALLAEAGYPDGFETTLTYPSTTLMNDVCQMIKAQLEQVGIIVTLNPIEGAAYVNYIGGWESGMLCHTMGFEAGAPSQYATTFYRYEGFGLGVNAFEISDTLDELTNKIKTSTTEEELNENTKAVAKQAFDVDCVAKVVLVTKGVAFTSTKLHGGNYATVQNLRYDLWNAWLEK